MLGKARKAACLGLILFLGFCAFNVTPAHAGVDLAGSDISDPADPISSPKTHADVVGTGPVLSVIGDEKPVDRRVSPSVEPEAPVDAPGADARIHLD